MNILDKLSILSEYHGLGYTSIDTLVDIRDRLLISLISQLKYNKQLINRIYIYPITQVNAGECLKSRSSTNQGNCYFQKRRVVDKQSHLKRIRQIIKRKPTINSSFFQAKNDTKNIPKNYGKAILNYILKSSTTNKATNMLGINYSQFLITIRKMKNKINSIDGLRKMWGSDNLSNKVKKCIRILSYQFMRKHCLRYIFCSKVRNFGTHIKYRQKLIEGIEDPVSFSHIKDY